MILTVRINRLPTSTNGLHRNAGKGRRRSAEYSNWLNLTMWELAEQTAFKFPDPCYYETEIFLPGCSKLDLDNHVKAVHDVLAKAGITPDDRYLVSSKQSFWGGKYTIVNIRKGDLQKWLKIRKPSKSLTRKLVKSNS